MADDQDKLRASEQRLRSMVETMPAGAVYREGDTITLNRAAEEIVGYQRSELKTLDEWFIALYGPEAVTVREYYEQDRNAGFPSTRIVSLTRKDGEQRRVEFAAARNEHSEVWLLNDVTERWQADTALKLSEAHVKSILDTAVDGIINIDTSGVIQTANAATSKIFGYESEELIGKNVKMLMPEPFHSQHDGYINNYLRTAEKKIIGIGREVEGLRKDGSIFPLELSVSEVKTGQEHSFTGMVRDISERRRAEEQLRLREEELSLTLENAPTGIAMLGTGGEFFSANRSFCVMVGHSERELLEMTFEDVTHPDDRTESRKLFRQAMEGETAAYTLEKRYLKKDGSVIRGILHCAVVHDASGAPFRLVAQLEDRTDQIRAAEEARQQRERLEHVTRLSTMGELASGIAHEVNQPLTAIATYAEACKRLVTSGQQNDDELPLALEKISNSAHRAGEVIRRLRRMIKKESADRILVDMNELVEDVVELARVDSRLHHTTIGLEVAPRLSPVLVDNVQIQQVVLNLIRNAVDAMLDSDPDSRIITVRTGATETEVYVTVEDRGRGISDGVAKNIFTPFFTTKPSGIGIGLSICQSIVSAHGGELTFEANEHGGATFTLALPFDNGG